MRLARARIGKLQFDLKFTLVKAHRRSRLTQSGPAWDGERSRVAAVFALAVEPDRCFPALFPVRPVSMVLAERVERILFGLSDHSDNSKLMPGHPDPRMNLAMRLESAGRTDEAFAAYGTALEVAPEHIAAMQAIASLQLRSGKADDRTPGMLREIALRGDDESWRSWAQGQLAMREGR